MKGGENARERGFSVEKLSGVEEESEIAGVLVKTTVLMGKRRKKKKRKNSPCRKNKCGGYRESRQRNEAA